MALRRVIKSFRAVALPRGNDLSCGVLEGYDNSGDVNFGEGTAPLNDGSFQHITFVDGQEFVRFIFSVAAFCVERSIFEDSTVVLGQPNPVSAIP